MTSSTDPVSVEIRLTAIATALSSSFTDTEWLEGLALQKPSLHRHRVGGAVYVTNRL
jgi:hypothetical protein